MKRSLKKKEMFTKANTVKRKLLTYEWSPFFRTKYYFRISYKNYSLFWYGKKKTKCSNRKKNVVKEIVTRLGKGEIVSWGTNVFCKKKLAEFCQKHMETRFLSSKLLWKTKHSSLFLEKVFQELGWNRERKKYSDYLTRFFLLFSYFSAVKLVKEWKSKGGQVEELNDYLNKFKRKGILRLDFSGQKVRVVLFSKDWQKEGKKLERKYLPFLPMVAVPKKWSDRDGFFSKNFSGGYYFNEKYEFYPLQKPSEKLRVKGSKEWFVSFNRLQAQGFRLDWERLLQVIQTEEKLGAHLKKLLNYMFPNDPLYFPMYVDGRGRMYAKGVLSPTFFSVIRGLLKSEQVKEGVVKSVEPLVSLDAPSSSVQIVSCLLRMEKEWLEKVNIGTKVEKQWYQGPLKKEVWKLYVFYSLFGLKKSVLKEYDLFVRWNQFFSLVEKSLPGEWSWSVPSGLTIFVKAEKGTDLAAHLVHSIEGALVLVWVSVAEVSPFFWVHDGVLVPAEEVERTKVCMAKSFEKVFLNLDLREFWKELSCHGADPGRKIEEWLEKNIPKRKIDFSGSRYLLREEKKK